MSKPDHPSTIAADLLKEQGPQRAIEVAMECVYEAQQRGDNYKLSIWREVKRVLSEISAVPTTNNHPTTGAVD